MRLKTFYANTVTEAMQMVRDMLGEDAIIVSTREERGGKGVALTAAVEPGFDRKAFERGEPAFEVGRGGFYGDDDDDDFFDAFAEDDASGAQRSSGSSSGSGWLQYDDEDEEYAVTEEITEAMLKHGVPEDVLDHVISCATVIGLEQPSVALVAALEHLYGFTPLPKKASRKPIIFLGGPGSGKTLAVAKMAARGVMNDLKIGVISTDTVRAGGLEQLSSFTKLMQVDLKKAKTATDLKAMLADMRGEYDQILIDTQGINPFSREDIKQAALLCGAADMESVLVMPAGLDAQESGEIARAFAALDVQKLMVTRIDMARRLGGILCAAQYGGMSFTDTGNTHKVANGLIAMTPQILAKLLMPHSYRHDGAQASSSTSSTSASSSSKSPAAGGRSTTAPYAPPPSKSTSTPSDKRKRIKQ
jgi:flagellar biosynthesis protein FlhF